MQNNFARAHSVELGRQASASKCIWYTITSGREEEGGRVDEGKWELDEEQRGHIKELCRGQGEEVVEEETSGQAG